MAKTAQYVKMNEVDDFGQVAGNVAVSIVTPAIPTRARSLIYSPQPPTGGLYCLVTYEFTPSRRVRKSQCLNKESLIEAFAEELVAGRGVEMEGNMLRVFV